MNLWVAILRFQKTFKIVLPLFLVCDMVHSCYYVTRLYKRRMQVEVLLKISAHARDLAFNCTSTKS